MAHLVRVGNSLGIRILKAIIAQVKYDENTDLEFKVTEKGLLISPSNGKRIGWQEAFSNASDKAESNKEQSELLMGEAILNEFDKDEWEW